MLVDDNTYTDNSHFFNGIVEADRLMFGVLGHCGMADDRNELW